MLINIAGMNLYCFVAS